MLLTDASELAATSACLCLSVYELSGDNKKRVPNTTPEAPNVSKEAIWAPFARPPAPRTGGPPGGLKARISGTSVNSGGA